MITAEFTESVLNEFMVTLPFHLFAYIPFRQHLRFEKKKMAFILAAIQLFYMTLYSILLCAGVPLCFIRIFTVLAYGIPFFLLVRMEWGKICFLYIFTADFVIIVLTASAYLAQIITGLPGNIYSCQAGLINIFIFLATLPFMLRYFCRTAQNIFEIYAPEIWNKVWILPLCECIAVYQYIFSPTGERLDITYLLPPVFLMGSILLLYHYIIQSINQFQKHLAAQDKIQQLEMLTKIQSEQYNQLKSRIEDTRRFRHDLRQHLRAIQGYLDEENLISLKKYLNDLHKNIILDIPHTWCQNPAVDAILGFYAQKAFSAGIDMKILFHTKPDTVIPEPEFCVLLGNLLENALDACASDKTKRPMIQVHARQTGQDMLTLTVDNTCSAAPCSDNGTLLSSKHSGSGIGTESVRIIAERYHGDARFEWKNGIFYASVMLNPQDT